MSDQNDLAKFGRKTYRDGYLQSKVRGLIAYQIQALREKTGFSQTQFAKKIGKKQSIVSRLEDTEYGRVTVQTLLDIACALDLALVVKFASYPDFLRQTRDSSVAGLQPDAISESLAKAEQASKQPKRKSGAAFFSAGEDVQNYSAPLHDDLRANDNYAAMGAFLASREIRSQR